MNIYLQLLLAWIERAIAILESAAVTPPPANQAERVGNLLSHLRAPAPPSTIPPKSAQYLKQNLKGQFGAASDTVLQVVTKTEPALESVFYAAYRNLAYRAPVQSEPSEPGGGVLLVNDAVAPAPSGPKVYAFRTTASLFGSKVPRRATAEKGVLNPYEKWEPWSRDPGEARTVVFLDNAYDNIQSGEDSYIVLQNPDGPTVFTNQQETESFGGIQAVVTSRSAYGFSGNTTKITLPQEWRIDPSPEADWEKVMYGTVVYAQSEELALASEPVLQDIQGAEIELADLYNGLKAGQWLIVTGERTDIQDVRGVKGTELVMLAGIEQIDAAHPEDRTRSKLLLANDLRYTYDPATVTIYGNVVKATHGETRNETLGNGNASQALQAFTLKQPPLTFVPASNPRGVESTLHVRVNDIEWHEVENLGWLAPTDRNFITRTADNDKTTVIFGNGRQGARLPTGIENIKAVYRNGIGKPGNVKPEQISLLVTRPLGVKEVINPLRASGGADKETRDQARRNAPLAVLALDRLVSTQDYADFTRIFAGIGKASAARISDGHRELVHVTIAGADDIPIDPASDLFQSLVKALQEFGDPHQPFLVEPRELVMILISANISILPDYLWEAVVTKIRTKLVDTFSFEKRELGQDVVLSEVIRVIQSVDGVDYVDVDTLGGISERNKSGELRTPAEIAEYVQKLVDDSHKNGPLPRVGVTMATEKHPAQLAFLLPDVEGTLILNEVQP
jgi:hypothetical protein